MKMKVLLVAIAISGGFIMCHSDAKNPTPEVDHSQSGTSKTNLSKPPETGKINILFVGNSLTYSNNLPDLVEQAAISVGKEVVAGMVALPNYALEDHWFDGEVNKLIASGSYQYVVVQQGPSSQADGRTMLLEYGRLIKDLCDKHQVKLAFFMVWPAKVNYHMFPGVIANYTEAARQTNSILCPVGAIWKSKMDATNDFSYFGEDGFHPSLKGSQSAAEIIVKYLFEK
jgi:hypothetical protein